MHYPSIPPCGSCSLACQILSGYFESLHSRTGFRDPNERLFHSLIGDVHTCRDFQHALERSVHGSFGLREPERLAVSLAIHNSPQEKPRATCRFAARNATLSLLLDEGVFHRDSLAKNVAAAFFMISRSSRSAAFSRRRRRISPSCELVTAFSVSVAAPWPSLRRHVCNRDG